MSNEQEQDEQLDYDGDQSPSPYPTGTNTSEVASEAVADAQDAMESPTVTQATSPAVPKATVQLPFMEYLESTDALVAQAAAAGQSSVSLEVQPTAETLAPPSVAVQGAAVGATAVSMLTLMPGPFSPPAAHSIKLSAPADIELGVRALAQHTELLSTRALSDSEQLAVRAWEYGSTETLLQAAQSMYSSMPLIQHSITKRLQHHSMLQARHTVVAALKPFCLVHGFSAHDTRDCRQLSEYMLQGSLQDHLYADPYNVPAAPSRKRNAAAMGNPSNPTRQTWQRHSQTFTSCQPRYHHGSPVQQQPYFDQRLGQNPQQQQWVQPPPPLPRPLHQQQLCFNQTSQQELLPRQPPPPPRYPSLDTARQGLSVAMQQRLGSGLRLAPHPASTPLLSRPMAESSAAALAAPMLAAVAASPEASALAAPPVTGVAASAMEDQCSTRTLVDAVVQAAVSAATQSSAIASARLVEVEKRAYAQKKQMEAHIAHLQKDAKKAFR